MLFQTLESIDIIIITCWLVVIAALIIAGIIFIKKTTDKTDRIRIYLISIGIFFILYSINRLIFFIHEIIFDPFMWSISLEQYNEIMNTNILKFARYDILWRISTAIGSIGLLIFLITFESKILEKKTKFVLSIVQGVTLTISLILGANADKVDLGRYILYLGLLPALAVPFLYFYMAAKSSGDIRKLSVGAGFGFFIFYIGVAANSSAGKSIFNHLWGLSGLQVSYLVYGIMVVVGLAIYIKSIKY